MQLIEQGNTVRRVAATQMNEQSSRYAFTLLHASIYCPKF